MTEKNIVVCALYHFVTLDDYEQLREPLQTVLTEHNVCGTLLLAREGINGTIAGSRSGIDAALAFLRADIRCKESYTDSPPFHRCKVKLKKEIVTMGVADIDPNNIVGTYIKPKDWNALISDPEVTLIDTRNEYEVQIGSFTDAVNPHTKSFREFPAYAEQALDPGTHKKVAMFCTGGIRCEKSTAYLKSVGFDEVYHLEGGILKYLEEVPEDESLWQGECFVFDDRVTVNHQLERGQYDQCHACRMPITAESNACVDSQNARNKRCWPANAVNLISAAPPLKPSYGINNRNSITRIVSGKEQDSPLFLSVVPRLHIDGKIVKMAS